jgi:hypothetical protein
MYQSLRPIFPLLRKLKNVTTTEQVGRAMISPSNWFETPKASPVAVSFIVLP